MSRRLPWCHGSRGRCRSRSTTCWTVTSALDLECLDRLYLHGYLGQLQVGGQVIQFLSHRGYPVPSPACLQQIGDAFRRRVASFAEANHIPVVTLKAADRNIEVMQPYLDRAAATGRSQVAAIGVAQEPQRVFIARQRDTDPGKLPAVLLRQEGPPGHGLLLLPVGRGLRPGVHQDLHVLPLAGENLGQRARVGQAAGPQDRVRLHRAVQRVRLGRGPGHAAADLRRAAARHDQRVLPALAGPAAAAAGRRRPGRPGTGGSCSMAQVEVSRTIVFTQPRHARAFFEALVADNLDLGRPDTVEIVFEPADHPGRQRATRGTFKTKVITRGTEVTINAFYRTPGSSST